MAVDDVATASGSPILSGTRERAMRRRSVVCVLGLLVSACAATAPVPTTFPSSRSVEPSVEADGRSAYDEAFAAAAAVGPTRETVEAHVPDGPGV